MQNEYKVTNSGKTEAWAAASVARQHRICFYSLLSLLYMKHKLWGWGGCEDLVTYFYNARRSGKIKQVVTRVSNQIANQSLLEVTTLYWTYRIMTLPVGLLAFIF